MVIHKKTKERMIVEKNHHQETVREVPALKQPTTFKSGKKTWTALVGIGSLLSVDQIFKLLSLPTPKLVVIGLILMAVLLAVGGGHKIKKGE